MLEILIVAMVTLFSLNLAKHPKRRYSLRRVRTTAEVALVTLAASTAITVSLTGTSDSQYRFISAHIVWDLIGQTAGQGPVVFGFAHGDYSVTEIKEAIEVTNSISQGDKIASERANRLIRIVGTFGANANGIFNDGRPLKTRLNWLMPVGEQVNIFAYNDFGSSLTTGAVLNVNGSVYVKDAS